MLRSMFTAVSALRNHQTYMNVIGNNIANVNTTAFKTGRITFQDMLSQTVRGSSAPTNTRGGINPAQLGLGMAMGGIDMMYAQGDLQPTGRTTDLAIQGDGFFVLSDGSQSVYTRDGAFDVDASGYLCSPVTGMRVQGWQAVNGTVDSTRAIGDVQIPMSSLVSRPTSAVSASGNLDASAAAGATATSTLVVYDSLGVSHNVTITYTKGATANTWSWAASTTDASVTLGASSGTLTFSGTGILTGGGAGSLALTFTNGAAAQTAAVDFASVTQLAQSSAIDLSSQDGLPPGDLNGFAISSTGVITGTYSNGLTQTIGQVAVAQFANPGGLSRLGGNAFSVSASSGQAVIGEPGANGRGAISSGALEMSNVDMAQQFTNMIMAQRGFQANSRVITTSDEMLQDLIQMKR
jgi:flagellar hook protein FlgE